jgi:branched-chain amino acid transport system permease protein
MHDRLKRIAALVALVLAFVILGGTAAQASPPTASDEGGGAACKLPEPTDDETISILGRICDRRETPQAPVEGVDITVEDSGGNVVGEATTGADGTFVVQLPGASIDHLGKTYTVAIDEGSLPEDTEPDVLTRKVTVNLDTDQSVSFPIGGVVGGSGTGTQAIQLVVTGLVFSVLLAMAALGLSMIFGTTGLTNCAHGELITFGAIIAYTADQLPGAIR